MAPARPIEVMPNKLAPYRMQMLWTSSHTWLDMSVIWATPAWTGSTV